MDEWRTIPEFPKYAVSSLGLIMYESHQRLLAQYKNQHGVVIVGLMGPEGRQYKRSVALLVARSFLPTPPPRFDTPMHLDTNRDHNFVQNLAWRPRPFTVDYYKQFRHSYPSRVTHTIEEVHTGRHFENSLQAARAFGVLERAVVTSILNDGAAVFPTGSRFRVLES